MFARKCTLRNVQTLESELFTDETANGNHSTAPVIGEASPLPLQEKSVAWSFGVQLVFFICSRLYAYDSAYNDLSHKEEMIVERGELASSTRYLTAPL